MRDRGDWMQTYMGVAFYPLDPTPEDIDPRDIAHALSLLCRYGGHVQRFYSVAEHCVLMSHAVPEEYALEALLHDATEAYLGDVIRPLKRALSAYQVAEGRVADAIADRFRQPRGPMSKVVAEADNRILLDERAALLGPSPRPWSPYIESLQPLGVQIVGLQPVVARHAYQTRLKELGVDLDA